MSAKETAPEAGQPTAESAEESVMSGIPSRPFCKGRAYDPNRYNSDSSEE